jgi:hypothetical protein
MNRRRVGGVSVAHPTSSLSHTILNLTPFLILVFYHSSYSFFYSILHKIFITIKQLADKIMAQLINMTPHPIHINDIIIVSVV